MRSAARSMIRPMPARFGVRGLHASVQESRGDEDRMQRAAQFVAKVPEKEILEPIQLLAMLALLAPPAHVQGYERPSAVW
jgi:hypothetical protein